MKSEEPDESCLNCGYFNKHAKQHYKCATRACPGINWPEARKKEYLKQADNAQ